MFNFSMAYYYELVMHYVGYHMINCHVIHHVAKINSWFSASVEIGFEDVLHIPNGLSFKTVMLKWARA